MDAVSGHVIVLAEIYWPLVALHLFPSRLVSHKLPKKSQSCCWKFMQSSLCIFVQCVISFFNSVDEKLKSIILRSQVGHNIYIIQTWITNTNAKRKDVFIYWVLSSNFEHIQSVHSERTLFRHIIYHVCTWQGHCLTYKKTHCVMVSDGNKNDPISLH